MDLQQTDQKDKTNKVQGPHLEVSSQSNSFSSRLYGINWQEHFPKQLNEEISVRLGSWDEASTFYQDHSREIYQEDKYPNDFLANESHSSKERYYKEMGDFFLFCQGKDVVGVFVCNPIDWSSYYLRNCSILPSFQGKKIYQKFINHLLEVLHKHKLHRLEVDISPANLTQVHIHNKFQFNVTGQWITERWGALLHLTKFLARKPETVFLKQFCHGIRPQIEKQSLYNYNGSPEERSA